MNIKYLLDLSWIASTSQNRMRNAFKSKGKTFTNWITNADGTISERPVKVYTVGDGKSGVYELEICSDFLGLVLETDFYGELTLVKSVESKVCDKAVHAAVREGDVLISVNNHVMLHEDFEDVIAYLNVLRDSNIPRRLRFLNTSLCPIAVYMERLALDKRSKDRTDMYGFVRSAEYLRDEHLFMTANTTAMSMRDRGWITYLKSIGGSANLKPFAQYTPSPKLKLMVRRGIPAAFRPLLWQHISLCSHFQSKFPIDYYSSLLAHVNLQLSATVLLDIAKDVGRTFPDHEILNSEKGGHLHIFFTNLLNLFFDLLFCVRSNFTQRCSLCISFAQPGNRILSESEFYCGYSFVVHV